MTRAVVRCAWSLIGAATLTACAGFGGFSLDSSERTTIVVAVVSNPQMNDAVALSHYFQEANPDIDVQFVSLPENEARAKITASVATGGGEFDVVMISNYETAMWAENGWLVNLQPYADATDNYDTGDFIEPVRESLSVDGDMYSVPFYGESSFLVYRTDLFDEAGLEMPEQPTWEDVREFAATIDAEYDDVDGICLRGLAGWGENLAPLNTVIHTFGGRWFDKDWNAQLTSPEVSRAVEFYVDLLRDHGQAGAATSGYADCGTRYAQGRAGMWYDATAMVNIVENPTDSNVVGDNGYAPAPVMETESAGWLYAWSLGIPASSEHPEEAWRFIAWMTDKEYPHLVGAELGWDQVPPGSRTSTYAIPEYAEVAEAYAEPTLRAMERADQDLTIAAPVPYDGIQFLAIPEFQDLGTRVAQQVSAAVADQISVGEALEQAQRFAETVGESYQSEEEGR
ncbi:sugar ABC transporter substrate-binding protein [Actinobacteria bacterium YIM 96077]|uniref:Sugar ABC transporter substrate-binding protein n=1 Tax=Phytoactinopolyspora halophila TaxID=1981511 RepID=A0A329QLZ8_9ACTN|nr:sugar ABC transporter substrate-binding protein [Phytoactinopolyspora halophila]AYY13493.1 sugar ABC transporter substrate-binding protein [Actinobacteria bacterium YIM 96077]RAW12452.1 sugar ABC transporter substrate-binding protein [Phytoactinopolyspora halophila]